MTKTSQPTRPRAVLYSRLSRESLVSTSLAGQADDLDALAEREGWDVVARFVDESLSGGKRRAQADESLRMLADGEADILAAYSVDRYSRQGVCEDAAVVRVIRRGVATARQVGTPAPRVVFVREGIDSGPDPENWAMRYVMASEMAYGERQLMVSRRKGSIRRMQTAGRFTGRGPAPWGYRSAPNPTGAGRILVRDPDEAAVIRATAARLIAGESGTSVARDMVARGIPTPRSAARLAILRDEDPSGLDRGLWSSSRVAQAMQNQYLLGRIVQRTTRTGSAQDGDSRDGQVVLGADGQPLQAFEPILDIGTFLALQDRFASGAGRGQHRQRKAARIGSGLVFCGYCGAICYVNSAQGDRYVAYRCSTKTRGGATCDGLRVSADIVEAAIEAAYLADRGDMPAVEYVERRGAPEVDDQIAGLTERIRAVGQAIIAPGADVASLAREVADLQARRDGLLATPNETHVQYVELGGTWRDVWADASLEERRRYLAAAFDGFDIYRPDAPERVVPRAKPASAPAPVAPIRPDDVDPQIADGGASRGPGHGPVRAPRARR